MSDTALELRLGGSSEATGRLYKWALRILDPRFGVFLLFFLALSARSAMTHDLIDAETARGLIASANEAAARADKAAEPEPEAEARFALGMVLVQVADILNRDLGAHGGQLTFNAEHLFRALEQRGLAPQLDEALGRYRTPRKPFEEALRLAPEAPYARRARFELLKAAFYESFVLDPFKLVGIGFDDLERQIAEAEALSAELSDPALTEEAAFVYAVDLARAAKLAPSEAARAAYAERANGAIESFAERYPDGIRAATARALRDMIAEGK